MIVTRLLYSLKYHYTHYLKYSLLLADVEIKMIIANNIYNKPINILMYIQRPGTANVIP